MKSLNKCQKIHGRFCSLTWNTELIMKSWGLEYTVMQANFINRNRVGWQLSMTRQPPSDLCGNHRGAVCTGTPHGAVSLANGVCFCGFVHISCFHQEANITLYNQVRPEIFSTPCKSCPQAQASLGNLWPYLPADSSDNSFSGTLHPCLVITWSQEGLGHYNVMTPTG